MRTLARLAPCVAITHDVDHARASEDREVKFTPQALSLVTVRAVRQHVVSSEADRVGEIGPVASLARPTVSAESGAPVARKAENDLSDMVAWILERNQVQDARTFARLG